MGGFVTLRFGNMKQLCTQSLLSLANNADDAKEQLNYK